MDLDMLRNVVSQLLLLFDLYSCQQEMLFRRYRSLDDYLCNPVQFTATNTTLLSCGLKCLSTPYCRSIFYKQPNGDCFGCEQLFTNGDVEALENNLLTHVPDGVLDKNIGTKYYRPGAKYLETCSEPLKPCIGEQMVCYSGLDQCVCDPTRYTYSPFTGKCVEDCGSLGDTYQRYPISAFWNHDGQSSSHQYSLTQCLDECTSRINCYGVDYDFLDHLCAYNVDPVTAAPSDWSQTTDRYDFYLRNCG